MEKIGIIGAGTMGSGIAQVVALANYKVTIFDADQQKMEQASLY
jgi:3-hydroxybutyryl-CoA dehydrogenase